jgi:hypothetical protein
MNKKTLKDYLGLLVYVAVGFGVMLMLIHTFGELHGLISTTVIFMVQTGSLFMRVGMLERQLQSTQQPAGAERTPQ